MVTISDIAAREILDSRGNPTVEPDAARYLGGPLARVMPVPLMNIVDGGAHATLYGI